ncbi:MAG TPA: DUF1365 domain-containing protein [Rhodobacteraceae bacterium]|jgi:DUF1365 family protein|nr:DUF1365 domain-containing protein [Paracoccaceae bacterium]HBR60878.1 DUF1365 domain-containing protein [Paracoccaceae bacterium]|tara:strand:- start:20 stop:775 length:756 start_codon:yes stop_codon:yes gene_type:complete
MTPVEHLQGHTWHGRKGAIKNAFQYSIDYALINLSASVSGPILFSHNSPNLMSLRDRDHGGAPRAGRGLLWAQQVLQSHNLGLEGDIFLLAQPRVLGHVFNPVSFWLCHDKSAQLCAVIAEVSNTFGDRHSYLCCHPDLRPITAQETINAEKIFHVSPFQPLTGAYTFRFDITAEAIDIKIDYTTPSGGVIATLRAAREPMTNRSILGALRRRPFGSRRVLALIHWQALKLWWKGARFHVRPEPPNTEVSQ